jgi:hypothetical protein
MFRGSWLNILSTSNLESFILVNIDFSLFANKTFVNTGERWVYFRQLIWEYEYGCVNTSYFCILDMYSDEYLCY